MESINTQEVNRFVICYTCDDPLAGHVVLSCVKCETTIHAECFNLNHG
jgi:hypothetical protein